MKRPGTGIRVMQILIHRSWVSKCVHIQGPKDVLAEAVEKLSAEGIKVLPLDHIQYALSSRALRERERMGKIIC